jgi:hypothetical protein
MRIKLHHVNLCSTNVPAMDAFYRTVLGLEREPGLNAVRVTATARRRRRAIGRAIDGCRAYAALQSSDQSQTARPGKAER